MINAIGLRRVIGGQTSTYLKSLITHKVSGFNFSFPFPTPVFWFTYLTPVFLITLYFISIDINISLKFIIIFT